MSKYILVDEYTHDEMKGQPKYFEEMTGIGPMSTADKSKAMRYDSEEDAKTSTAHRHWSANWKIEEVES